MINAHGKSGELVNRIATGDELDKLMAKATKLPQVVVAERFLSDVELIANGALSPLTGFMSEKDAKSVIDNMELADGTLWAIPVVLPVTDEQQKQFKPGDEIALLSEDKVRLTVAY